MCLQEVLQKYGITIKILKGFRVNWGCIHYRKHKIRAIKLINDVYVLREITKLYVQL